MHENFIGLTIPIIVLTAVGTVMSLIMVSISKNIQNNSKVSMWLLSVVLACAMLVLIVIFIVSFKKEQFKILETTDQPVEPSTNWNSNTEKAYKLEAKSDSECANDLIEAAIYYTEHNLN